MMGARDKQEEGNKSCSGGAVPVMPFWQLCSIRVIAHSSESERSYVGFAEWFWPALVGFASLLPNRSVSLSLSSSSMDVSQLQLSTLPNWSNAWSDLSDSIFDHAVESPCAMPTDRRRQEHIEFPLRYDLSFAIKIGSDEQSQSAGRPRESGDSQAFIGASLITSSYCQPSTVSAGKVIIGSLRVS